MNPTYFVKAIMLSLSRGPTRLFRNNTGRAYMGHAEFQQDGSVLIRQPRVVGFGLAVGSGDLIGWRSLEITPAMVGQSVAQFLSIECKQGSGRASAEQVAWRDAVIKAGGYAAVVRSQAEAVQQVGGSWPN